MLKPTVLACICLSLLCTCLSARQTLQDPSTAWRTDTMACCLNIGHHIFLLEMEEEPGEQAVLSGSLDHRFVRREDFSLALLPDRYYWAGFRLYNGGKGADFLVSFPLDISEVYYYEMIGDSVVRGKAGNMIPDPDHVSFQFPGMVDHAFKTHLPAGASRKYYFRVQDRSGRIEKGFFSPSIRKPEQHYRRVVRYARETMFFAGAVGIFLLLNLLLYFYVRARPFLYYVLYLSSILFYGVYSSGMLKGLNLFGDLFAIKYYLRLNYYLISISYLAFIRSFLDLKHMLPAWDRAFQFLIYFAALMLTGSALYFALVRYNIALIDSVYGLYLIVAFLFILIFLGRLSRVKDVRAKFIFWGGLLIILGVVPTIYSLVFNVFGINNVVTVQAGLIGEMVVFSLGLAYSQAMNERSKQAAIRKQEVVEAKSRIYANVTHEFRTPLTVILGLAEQVRQQGNEKLQTWARAIERNGKTLLDLINQMLALSKAETGAESLIVKHADVVPFLKYVVESFQSYAESRQIDLTLECSAVTFVMDYDSNKLQKILSNLISNAIKFNRPGGRVEVRISGAGEGLEIVVTDTGMGIDPSELPHIFERYYQVQDGSAAGSGIGLTLVKTYVDLWNGQIGVDSKPGEGTTFHLRLPRKSPSAELARKTDTPDGPELTIDLLSTPPASQDDERPVILLVEDNRDVLLYLSEILEESYRLLTAADGQLGIHQAWKVIPDLIISDVMMPRKDGFEVCEALRQDERTSHIPIILLTAKADFNDRLGGLQSGADVYLTKPFRKSELLVQVNRLLAQRKALQSHYSQLALLPTTQFRVPEGEEGFLYRLQTVIEENLSDEDFGIQHICQALHISRMHLHRKVKALTDQSASQFIRNIRLQRAKDLLTGTELSVSEIAHRVGFRSSSYFSRSFTGFFQLSPSDFRQVNI